MIMERLKELAQDFREGMSAINKYHKAEGIALILVGVVIGYLL